MTYSSKLNKLLSASCGSKNLRIVLERLCGNIVVIIIFSKEVKEQGRSSLLNIFTLATSVVLSETSYVLRWQSSRHFSRS